MNLRDKPFYLKSEDIEWVLNTLAKMTLKQKIAQLFCVNINEGQEYELEDMLECYGGVPGAVMYRPMPWRNALYFTRKLMEHAEVPMLIAANLEKGGSGIVSEGVTYGSPMEVAATDDDDMAEKLAVVCAREAAAVGVNWTFAPIIDIDYNYHNPITNTRTFGSDPERVARMGKRYVESIQKMGIAATIKHFPGDGIDERDQHLVTSVNTLSCEKWDDTYGKVYKECIDAGAMACMAAHIQLPAYSRVLNPDVAEENILPASLASELMKGLLREKLGFNGVIVTDATTMAGFTIPMSRRLAVPLAIAAGADMFLFSRNAKEDFQFMEQGMEDGILTEERLNEAVTRILALKAALGLHKKKTAPDEENAKRFIGCKEHQEWASECADKSITLVKVEKGVLPLRKGKRILFIPLENKDSVKSMEAGPCRSICQRLTEEGFAVDVFGVTKEVAEKMHSTTLLVDHYDYIIYVANIATRSNQTVARIEWGTKCPHYIEDIPTIFISVNNPYHLLDIPRVKTFINCYNPNVAIINALVDKLLGYSQFKGKNPVDPFCGKWDARFVESKR